MDGARGWTAALDGRVRYSLSGLRLEPIPAGSLQLDGKRIAHPPAKKTHRRPVIRRTETRIQPRLSCSSVFIGILTVDRQPYEDGRAGIFHFVVARAFDPDPAVMGIHDPAGDRQPQAGTAAFELRLT